ncbi:MULTISPECIES: helix-turn-helix domain-containing protein [Variovorax]|jgi:AraC-like DNA-binding protein|uniref:helix-turn-helix domain-containing protein n=1 Tax=Variovorax TaxID=34072 RepID=UPI00086EA9A7|nr:MULTISPECIES: AraC family transcriptional regulator [Variovorax]MBN8753106.1 helix-turn-helix transcriptional regulator [Variovorax sp.]ODU11612.1 MAG: AraC family transcriptional regulator [Variovorax sp. SCN 67-85]ODV15023.1 MAG: AraC family transcriptional regulator [Variovorax sp. SCN 67-20]OJZ05257.1 MAG: AraC family transcriptional regulator [Variovorax sp. 67-131]UKI05309.1 AraC family transcriptional regulator [Variovorax paradoxus]
MQLTRQPAAHLQPFVRLLWASAPEGSRVARPGAREHVLPTGGMHLVFRLSGPPLKLFAGANDPQGETHGYAIVGGARSAFYMRDVSVATRSVGAQLEPGAARLLLGAPEDALAGRHTALDALWGAQPTADALAQIHAAYSAERQLAVFEALLTGRIVASLNAGMRGLHPAIAQALGPIARGSGSIAELVERSGYSHRRFIALFRGAIGLTPKEYARVMRFDRALALAAGSVQGWADVASAAGYSDQAHLSREFSALAGMPPQAWRRTGAASPRHVPASTAAGQIRSRR